MKRVLYVTHENVKGGATHSLLDLLDSLKEKILPSVIVPLTFDFFQKIKPINRSLYSSGCLVDELKKRGIEVYRAVYLYDNLELSETNFIKKLIYKLIRPFELRRIMKKLESQNIDVVHTNSSVVKFGSDLARKLNTRHIWHIREDVFEMFSLSIELHKKYIKNILNSHSALIFVSNVLRENFIKNAMLLKGNVNAKTIFNGIPIHKRVIKSKEYNQFIICSFGTVYKIKGQEDLIELARLLKIHEYNDVVIKIIGAKKEEYYNYLIKKINEHELWDLIEFVDYQNDLSELRNQASVEVICSRNEAFGRVAIEAMSAGNILIASDVGGLSEIVEHNTSGFKYTPGNVEELFKLILQVKTKSFDVEQMKKNALNRASYFDIKYTANSILSLY